MSILTAARRPVNPAAEARVLFDSAKVACPSAYRPAPTDRLTRYAEYVDAAEAVAEGRATDIPSWTNYAAFAAWRRSMTPAQAAAPAPVKTYAPARTCRAFEPSVEDRLWLCRVEADEERADFLARMDRQAEEAAWYDSEAGQSCMVDEMLAVGACG